VIIFTTWTKVSRAGVCGAEKTSVRASRGHRPGLWSRCGVGKVYYAWVTEEMGLVVMVGTSAYTVIKLSGPMNQLHSLPGSSLCLCGEEFVWEPSMEVREH
jgi:hypothetical protein